MKRFIILLIVVGLYYPSYAQEYQIDEIEEWAYAFFSKSPQYESSRTIQKQISSIEAIICYSLTNAIHCIHLSEQQKGYLPRIDIN